MTIGKKSAVSLLAVLLLLALTAVYWNHFDNAFHFDDSHTIVNNSFITDIHNLPLFFTDARTTSSLPLNQAYRPMVTALNAIDYWIAGKLDPKVFHLHIYLEFILLLVLLYVFFLHIFEKASGKRHYLAALLGVAFFAFHTATAETINYIIARSDGFSTLMVLAGALLYIKGKGWRKQLGLLPFIIGCLAKPTTLMLAPILLIYDLFTDVPGLLIRAEKPCMKEKLHDTLLSVSSYFVLGVVMYFFTRSMFSDTWVPSNVSAVHYLNTQPYIFWFYLEKFFVPTGLSADTDLGLIKQLLAPKVIWGLMVIVFMLIAAWKTLRNRSTLPIGFGILWFMVALVPSSSIIPLAEVMNHHRTFFPYLGLVMAVTWVAVLGYQRFIAPKDSMFLRILAGGVLTLILGANAYGTYQRNEVWDNEASLWIDVTKKSPKNGRGLMNYGLTKMRSGHYEEAIGYFDRALNTHYGHHPYLYVNMGIAKNSLADIRHDAKLKNEAERYLKTAVVMGPEYPDCQFFYGQWLYTNHRPLEAIGYLKKAIALSPAFQSAKDLLDNITMSADQLLRTSEQNAERLNTPESYLDLSLKYYNNGNYNRCINACNKAIALRPDYAEAYNNICSANNKLGRYRQAIEACNRALELSPDYALAKGNLNWAERQLKKGQ